MSFAEESYASAVSVQSAQEAYGPLGNSAEEPDAKAGKHPVGFATLLDTLSSNRNLSRDQSCLLVHERST